MLIHIGYHKTASSWLQQLFFPWHPGLKLVGRQPTIWQHLIEPHDFDFDATQCQKVFQSDIDEAMAEGLIPVLSAERLSGNPHSGGYDSKLIADRLFKVYPQARILIVVREQTSMLCSMYKQYVRAGGICSIQEYLQPVRDGRIPLFRHHHLCYHRLVGYYKSLFGENQVLTLPYELLLKSDLAFLKALCDYLSVDTFHSEELKRVIRPAECDLVIAMKRRVNHWHGNDSLYPITPRFPWFTERVFSAIAALNQNGLVRSVDCGYKTNVKEYAEGKYESSNQSLQEIVSFDLAEYGYAI